MASFLLCLYRNISGCMKFINKSGMVAQAYHPSTWEAEVKLEDNVGYIVSLKTAWQDPVSDEQKETHCNGTSIWRGQHAPSLSPEPILRCQFYRGFFSAKLSRGIWKTSSWFLQVCFSRGSQGEKVAVAGRCTYTGITYFLTHPLPSSHISFTWPISLLKWAVNSWKCISGPRAGNLDTLWDHAIFNMVTQNQNFYMKCHFSTKKGSLNHMTQQENPNPCELGTCFEKTNITWERKVHVS